MSNRLATETSPYLQQHADNPVDWYPWGEEAFKRAQNEDKPILLSIGYSACHWCHVMAHECFENSEIASLMNEKFVNIKADREERPDLDAIYMEAVQTMTGGGGWPLTVFLTPDGKPFFGGTYFPPEAGRGLPSLPQVLRTVAEAYKYRRDHVEQAAKQITTALAAKFAATLSAEPLAPEVLRQAYLGLRRDFDSANGGFGAAPKFPQTMALEFLLRYFYRSKDTDALEMVDLTLDKMARGGIYDQVGGGFHRYATDSQWLVPHFEKMLYDNALLSQLYLHAYLVKGREFFRHIAERTLDYVLREMASPDGGFYSTQDADSEGSEGKYYLWLPEEITHLMGEEAGRVVNDYFGVTGEGNFDGRNILHVASDPPPGGAIIIEQAKVSLLKRRRLRVAPARDEKILASWNGLMLASFAEAACILGRQDYLTAAVANGSFLLSHMISDGCLRHSYKDGQAKIDGYLEDYALVIEGLLALHQATFRGDWLRHAIRLTENMVKRFWDEETGAFYDTGQQHEGLFIRPRSTYDGALPSGSSGAAMALLKVARLIDNPHFEQIAAHALRAMRDFMVNHPLGHGNWLSAADFYLSQPEEIAIIGPRDSPATSELLHTLCNAWLPNKVVAAFDPNDPTPLSHLSLFRDRKMIDNQPTVYVCQRYACKTPVTDAEALRDQLREG